MEIRFKGNDKTDLRTKKGNRIFLQAATDEIKMLFCYEKYKIHGIRESFLECHKSTRGTDIKKK